MKTWISGLVAIVMGVMLSGCSNKSVSKTDKQSNHNYVKLKKTGQTKSYNEHGAEVTDKSIKDDGYYQSGVASSYTRDDSKEVVVDNITGLMWQDNQDARKVLKPWQTEESFNECVGKNGKKRNIRKCSDTSGDTAATYCDNLTLGNYNDWRLPSVEELRYIMIHSHRKYAINTTVFKNVKPAYYWTSTRDLDSEEGFVNVAGFFEHGYINQDEGTTPRPVRCVRGNRKADSHYVRNNKGVVVDNSTGLNWQDEYSDNSGKVKSLKWKDAIDYCESLSLGGRTDWRLPNLIELQSLIDYSQSAPMINPVFKNTAECGYPNICRYWSSSSAIPGNEDRAWFVDFDNGEHYYNGGYNKDGDKSKPLHVRCVSGGV